MITIFVNMKKMKYYGSLCGLLEYLLEKNLSTDYLCKSHDHDHKWVDLVMSKSWPDYCKTKENVNIMLLDLCLLTFYSVHANEST